MEFARELLVVLGELGLPKTLLANALEIRLRIEDEKLLAEQGPKKWLARRVQRAIAVAEFNRGVRREMAGRVVAQRRQSRQRRPVSDRAPVRLVSVVPRSRERRSSSRVSRAGPRGADSDEPEPPSRWPWRIGDVEHDRALTFELGQRHEPRLPRHRPSRSARQGARPSGRDLALRQRCPARSVVTRSCSSPSR